MNTYADVLIVIDLQNGVCYGENQLFDLQNLIDKVNKRIALYRQLHKPIIFIQHCDEELIPEENSWDLYKGKSRNDWFNSISWTSFSFQTFI